MTRKIFGLFALAVAVAIYSQAFSSSASAQKSEKETPPARPKTEAPAASSKVSYPGMPSVLPGSPAKKSEATKDQAKKSGSTSPVSASPADKAGRRELVIERALVTLKHDNKVPAAEPGML